MSCDGNYSKRFSTVYSPVSRAHIHIRQSDRVIHIHANAFLCIHLNVLNLLLSSALSVFL